MALTSIVRTRGVRPEIGRFSFVGYSVCSFVALLAMRVDYSSFFLSGVIANHSQKSAVQCLEVGKRQRASPTGPFRPAFDGA